MKRTTNKKQGESFTVEQLREKAEVWRLVLRTMQGSRLNRLGLCQMAQAMKIPVLALLLMDPKTTTWGLLDVRELMEWASLQNFDALIDELDADRELPGPAGLQKAEG